MHVNHDDSEDKESCKPSAAEHPIWTLAQQTLFPHHKNRDIKLEVKQQARNEFQEQLNDISISPKDHFQEIKDAVQGETSEEQYKAIIKVKDAIASEYIQTTASLELEIEK
jgi:transglutaminase/protease-like cytokinesis protein 3